MTDVIWLRATEAIRRHAFTEAPGPKKFVRSRCGTMIVHGKSATRRWHKRRPLAAFKRALQERTHTDGPRCAMCRALLTLDKVREEKARA